MATTQLCTFFVNGLFFGVDVQRVQEVVTYQTMTRVPKAPPVVRGLINLRGQVVVALDLRRRLGFADRAPDVEPMNVVLTDEGGAVSLLVDSIDDVLLVEDRDLAPRPETIEGAMRDLVDGVYMLEGRLLLRLDIEKTVNLC